MAKEFGLHAGYANSTLRLWQVSLILNLNFQTIFKLYCIKLKSKRTGWFIFCNLTLKIYFRLGFGLGNLCVRVVEFTKVVIL